MFLLDKIDIAISDNKKLSDTLYSCLNEQNLDINWDISDSVSLVNMFISAIPTLNNIGLEVDSNIPRMQLERLKEGIEYGDTMKIADCFMYEINDTLLTLKELVIGGIIKNEELL